MKTFLPAFFLFLFLQAFTSVASAQVKISGIVRDENKEPLIGVNILIKNSTEGTVTDLDGHFELQVADLSATLIFSYTGYAVQEIPLSGQTSLDIVLREESQLLNEVVVVGYGTQRKSDLTGAVATIKSEELQKFAAANVAQALQGKISGVQVSAGSGRPGESPVIRIRGTGTLNNASPIFVVDGLILDNIDFLNANDIERMEVLKDASSAAIYGTRGANGVILVTTKKGARSQKARFSFSAYQGMQEVDKKIALANGSEYAQLVNEFSKNIGIPAPYPNPEIFGRGTDWQDVIFREAPIKNYNLNISGGTDAVTYNISGDVFLQDGVIKSSYFNRYSLRVNNEYNLVKGLKVGHNLSFISSNSNREPGGIVFNAYAADPRVPPVDSLGKYGSTAFTSNVSNPAAQLEYNSYNRSNGQQINGNLFTEIYPLKNLALRSSMGFNLVNNRGRSFEPKFEVDNRQRNPNSRVFVEASRFFDWQWENTLNYSRDFGAHRISVLAGYTRQSRGGEVIGGSRLNLIGDTEEFFYLNSGDSETATNFNYGFNPERYESILFRLNYNWKERYLFTGTFRRDGSSKFGRERRFGNFPSLALAWRVTEEPFLKDQNLISNLKLRGSWGRLGNDKFPSDAAIPTVTNNLSAVFGPDEQLLFGASLITLANPLLQWEETTSANAGIELGLLDNRLTLEADYYYRQSRKILVPVPIPDYVGSAGDPYVNAADVRNSGVDLSLNYSSQAGKFRYRIGILGSTLQNEVVALGSGRDTIPDVAITGEFATLTTIGRPIGSFYGYRVAGVYQNAEEIAKFPSQQPVKPGDLRFEDINGDGIVNSKDRTYLGSPIPTLIYGLTLGLEYAGFDFSADLNGVRGNKILNSKKLARGFGLPNYEASFLNRWTGPGTSNTEPRIMNGGFPNFAVSDKYIEDGSFLRLRSLVLGYTFPKSLIQKIKLSNLRVYASANNLVTWTSYTGYSPEIGSNAVTRVGIDGGIYPISQTVLFGLNVGF
ncbi:MAG: hypothetical protein RL386_300 [Bacteroidota bacterium]